MENINEVIEKATGLSSKVTKFILILMTSVATIIGAWYGLKEDIVEKKATPIEEIEAIIQSDSLTVDSL